MTPPDPIPLCATESGDQSQASSYNILDYEIPTCESSRWQRKTTNWRTNASGVAKSEGVNDTEHADAERGFGSGSASVALFATVEEA